MDSVFGLAAAASATQLWTREKAKEIRPQMLALFETLNPGDTLVVDAAGVEVMDYSFANEFFGKTILSLAGEYPDRFFLVDHLTAYAHENLQRALESLGLQMIERKKKVLDLIGKVHSVDQTTFRAIASSKNPVTAASLAETLNANLTAINERLSKLLSFGIVRREKSLSAAGREQYEYRSLS